MDPTEVTRSIGLDQSRGLLPNLMFAITVLVEGRPTYASNELGTASPTPLDMVDADFFVSLMGEDALKRLADPFPMTALHGKVQLNILGMCNSGLDINFEGKIWRSAPLIVVDNLPVPFHLCGRHSEGLNAVMRLNGIVPRFGEVHGGVVQPFKREYVPHVYRDRTYWTVNRSFFMPPLRRISPDQ